MLQKIADDLLEKCSKCQTPIFCTATLSLILLLGVSLNFDIFADNTSSYNIFLDILLCVRRLSSHSVPVFRKKHFGRHDDIRMAVLDFSASSFPSSRHMVNMGIPTPQNFNCELAKHKFSKREASAVWKIVRTLVEEHYDAV